MLTLYKATEQRTQANTPVTYCGWFNTAIPYSELVELVSKKYSVELICLCLTNILGH